MGSDFALERFEIDFFKLDAAACDKFRFISRFALDGKTGLGELLGEELEVFIGHVAQRRIERDSRESHEPLPKVQRKQVEVFMLEVFERFLPFFREQVLEDIFLFMGGDPVDVKIGAVIAGVKVARGPRGKLEGCWTAEAPMCYEKAAALAERDRF